MLPQGSLGFLIRTSSDWSRGFSSCYHSKMGENIAKCSSLTGYTHNPLHKPFHPFVDNRDQLVAANCLRRSSPKEQQRPTAAAQQPPTVSGDHLPKKFQPLTISHEQACTTLKLGKRPKKLEAPQVKPTSKHLKKTHPHPSRPQHPTDSTN